MDRHVPHDYATTNVLAWTATQSANVEPCVEEDAGADADEPPDHRPALSTLSDQFKRAPVRRGSEHHESLLTKALQSHSDEDAADAPSSQSVRRRRSITSNFSLSSELTCDTGFTTPARTNSPSPRFSNVGFVPLVTHAKRAVVFPKPSDSTIAPAAAKTPKEEDPAVQALVKKRCISFACAAKPKTDDKVLMPPPPKRQEVQVPKKTCIRFACPSPVPLKPAPRQVGSPAAPPADSRLATRSPPSNLSSRSATPPASKIPKTWIAATSKDLQSECSRFHEFASDEPREDDWILRDNVSSRPKITINDTLEKENAIRKLGKEAEEEAEQEEEEDEDDEDENDDDEDENEGDSCDEADANDGSDEDEEEDDDDANEVNSVHKWDDEASDGYKTDNETGFADSDDEDDGLVLWTAFPHRFFSGATPVHRRPSVGGQSDSSDCSKQVAAAVKAKQRERRRATRATTPELPDSTDFVCGTLDEDRPLEEAYISHMAARKQSKANIIPQDIDPSFPTSEPEDEAEEFYKRDHGDSDDDLWLHGELEDLHHERDRAGRRRKQDKHSPKRLRSPPPKPRGRSPRRLFDYTSPQRLRSPAPSGTPRSPAASLVQSDQGAAFKLLASRPDLAYTKSLPRGHIMYAPTKPVRRARASTVNKEQHVRGAIDIVKGLEQKRQRRKEKFYQKYCTKARKEKAQERRPVPGQGAVRMREVGLIMAGRIGQGNFVISV